MHPSTASLGEPATWPYAFGALVCHQRPDRSFSLAGNQLPVCERCLAIELGMAAAFALAVLVVPRGGFVASLSAFLPERLRSTAGVLAVGLLLMLPMVLDGGLQLVTAYVSATPQRVAHRVPVRHRAGRHRHRDRRLARRPLERKPDAVTWPMNGYAPAGRPGPARRGPP